MTGAERVDLRRWRQTAALRRAPAGGYPPRAMAHASSDTHAASDTPREHPSLPPVHDDAPDTPAWVPALGLALLLLFALFGLLRAASRDEAPVADEGSAAEVPVEAPADAPPAE
jgi:hypothetical protein